jgi:hypothetical protein
MVLMVWVNDPTDGQLVSTVPRCPWAASALYVRKSANGLQLDCGPSNAVAWSADRAAGCGNNLSTVEQFVNNLLLFIVYEASSKGRLLSKFDALD